MSVSIKFNDHLLSMNEDDQENECLVCYDQLTSENTTTLVCNHKFHYECIVKSYTMDTNKKKSCPYCRRTSGVLPIVNGVKTITCQIHYKNTDEVMWMNKVHERITGYDTVSNFPADENYCLYHPKQIDRQEKQNEFYDTI